MVKKTIISSLCGWHYTLYLISITEGRNVHAYTFEGMQSSNFVSISVNNSNPIALFGGGENCASIDSNERISYIPKIINNSMPSSYHIASLPNREKAISISCCDEFIIALSSSGRVYMNKDA